MFVIRVSTRMYLCCIIPAKIIACTPTPKFDSITSCENILAHSYLRISVLIMATSAFIGNIFVIILNCYSNNHELGKTTKLVFNNLAASNFLMSTYLFIIAIGDNIYRDRYAQYAEEWLKNTACLIASFLICTSSLMSVFVMLAISNDCYKIISNPLVSTDTRHKRGKIILVHYNTYSTVVKVP